MTPLALIGLGAALVVLGIVILVGLIESERQEPEKADLSKTIDCPAAQTTIIGPDGGVIAPEGALVWQATQSMYDMYERFINPGPLWARDGYRWYLLDKVGTPVTDDEKEKITWQMYGYGG